MIQLNSELLKYQNQIRRLRAQFTPERFDELKKINQERGTALIDHQTIFDYNIDLHRCEIPGIDLPIYQVALSRFQIDPYDENQQNKTFSATMKQVFQTLSFIASLLHTWTLRYGALWIGSSNEDKINVYWAKISLIVRQKGLGIKKISNESFWVFDLNSAYYQELKDRDYI